MRRSRDKKIFARTARKTNKENLKGHYFNRGGLRK